MGVVRFLRAGVALCAVFKHERVYFNIYVLPFFYWQTSNALLPHFECLTAPHKARKTGGTVLIDGK